MMDYPRTKIIEAMTGIKQPKPISVQEFKSLPKPRKSKYGNKKVKVDGMTFDSMKEYRRWIELNILEKKGHILQLKRQVRFDLGVCKYVADFTYIIVVKRGTEIIWEKVVEDVKGFRTQVYKLKKKLMKQVHGITIKET